MLRCLTRIRSLCFSSQKTVNALSITQFTRTINFQTVDSISAFSRSSRRILQPCHHRFCLSIRNSNQFNVGGKEDFDIDSLFSDDLEPSYFDESEGYGRNYEVDNTFARSLNKVDYKQNDLTPFTKNFYNENTITTNRSENEIAEYYESNSIQVSGRDPPKPVLTFDEINFNEDAISNLRTKFDKPTPIQSITWPITLSGRNVIGIAQTGSGKTLSFLFPAMIHIQAQPRPNRGEGPIALVLCPTRELAKQCEFVARTFLPNSIRTVCLFGGGERALQLQRLSRGCDLAIATPGRLIDLLKTGELTMKQCSFLVLDEADRMLDMGFEPQIRGVIDQIRPDRQVTMWSATWPKEVRELASTYLTSREDPVQIKVGSSELIANKDVVQRFVICQSDKKDSTFFHLVRKLIQENNEHSTSDDTFSTSRRRVPRILVFANQKRTCDLVASSCRRGGVRANSLHGDLSQRQRDYVMDGFRKGYAPLMIATDVAARGLDIHNIDYVINYDTPLNCVAYIHRIGRTGRGGNRGTSVTILTEMDGAIVPALIKNLRDVDHPIEEKLLKMEEWWNKKKNSMKKRSFTRQPDMWGQNNRNNRFSRGGPGARRHWNDRSDGWYGGNDDGSYEARNFRRSR